MRSAWGAEGKGLTEVPVWEVSDARWAALEGLGLAAKVLTAATNPDVLSLDAPPGKVGRLTGLPEALSSLVPGSRTSSSFIEMRLWVYLMVHTE